MTLRLTPEAEADVDDAHAWYEEERIGLGDAFLRVVDASIASIQRRPEV